MRSKPFSVLIALILALFALTASIAVPILCRPFYYAHINALDLPEKTGWTYEQIKDAFDEMMDFELKGTEFGTGDLAWSESGKSHFADCRVLFLLDLRLFAATGIVLLLLLLYYRHTKSRPALLAGRGPSFWAAVILLISIGGFALFAVSDFDRAFALFHTIFFPGKTNWIFDPRKDQIILILPEEFFRNCGILVVALLAVFLAVYLRIGRKKRQ